MLSAKRDLPAAWRSNALPVILANLIAAAVVYDAPLSDSTVRKDANGVTLP
jgi:hypothetical protein